MKGIQAFLGLVGYFRHFIKGFAQRARPLYELLKKEADFVWTSSQENAFQELKMALVEAPVLAFPNFDKEFILTTDASGLAIGAILTQIGKDGKEHLISCHSCSLRGAEIPVQRQQAEHSCKNGLWFMDHLRSSILTEVLTSYLLGFLS